MKLENRACTPPWLKVSLCFKLEIKLFLLYSSDVQKMDCISSVLTLFSDPLRNLDNALDLSFLGMGGRYAKIFLGPRGPLIEPSISVRPPVPQQFFLSS